MSVARKIVEYAINALKAVFHRGAVDADGKTGDGAGIHLEIPSDFFSEKIEITGHSHDGSEICVGMIFLPRNNYEAQENARTLVESELTKSNFSIYGWRQVPVNTKVLGEKANLTRPEITQVLFKNNNDKITATRTNPLTAAISSHGQTKFLSIGTLWPKNSWKINPKILKKPLKDSETASPRVTPKIILTSRIDIISNRTRRIT